MIERKCLACGTWNKDEDLCTHCSNPISPDAIISEKEKKRKEEEAKIQPDKFDVFLDKTKNSKYLLVRLGYYFLYSIVMFIGGIGALFAWMAALANG